MKSNLYQKSKQCFSINNLFRELSMNNVIGYDELSEAEKDFFDQMYKKHLSSLREEERASYRDTNLYKVENGVRAVKVQFDNGDCFLYIEDGQYIKLTR